MEILHKMKLELKKDLADECDGMEINCVGPMIFRKVCILDIKVYYSSDLLKSLLITICMRTIHLT